MGEDFFQLMVVYVNMHVAQNRGRARVAHVTSRFARDEVTQYFPQTPTLFFVLFFSFFFLCSFFSFSSFFFLFLFPFLLFFRRYRYHIHALLMELGSYKRVRVDSMTSEMHVKRVISSYGQCHVS